MPTGSPSKSKPFVHLHVHSMYSLLDGACRTGDLVQRAKELEQPAVAVTDHGCLFGLVDFYSKAVAAGVKPIVGIEAYMTQGSRHDRTATGVKDGGYHLLLLAENLAGYQNLLKLGSIAYTEGFYYKPRIDKEVLQAHSEGLIATSACLGGEIPSALMKDDRKQAREIAETYVEVFGPDRFFIELQKHIREQDEVNPHLMDLADRLGVGCVATNDVHFLLAEDHAPHDALCCISTGKLLTEESRMRYPTQLYLKSTSEMYSAMDDPKWTQACENTLRIAKRCNVELDFEANHAPVVKIETQAHGSPAVGVEPRDVEAPVGSTAWYQAFCAQFQLQPFDSIHDADVSADQLKRRCDDALHQLCEAGLIWRYGEGGITDDIRARLDRELKVLSDKSISAYFLIVWDFVNEARRRGVPASARGSGVGTMVGYVLGLSNACPVKYGLLFERFTDPDRSEYPDIDIDICQDGRQQIIEYVRAKYGHVAQIITFGTLKARAAIRDVGRVLDVPLSEVDKVCKLVGDGLGMTIEKALDQEPDLRKLYDSSQQHQRMIDTARRLEGLARHAGVHAAGVVIATQPLDNIIPLYQPSGTDQLVTQWDGPTVEKMGLLKMDFLGLRTLSILERAKTLIRQTLSEQVIRDTTSRAPQEAEGGENHAPTVAARNDPLDLDRLAYDDQNVLDLFRRGETAGVFQFESEGMRNLLRAMKPDRLEDLIAANALYRPGPMDLIPQYNDRKHGRQPVPKVHPIVDKHTAETYGIMVYQEQVMQILHELGDIPLREAYTIIKAISKKKEKTINAARDRFIDGAVNKDLPREKANELFDLILKFAGYGFNKSHSTGYAIIAYQTAYLKTYFPVQYMAAVLTYESVNTDKVVEYIDACKRVRLPGGAGENDPPEKRGIDVRPPDINRSDIAFSVVYEQDEPRRPRNGHIRFGLSAVKGVGEKAIGSIIQERENNGPYKDLYDFCERVPLGAVNRATIEALIKCGAFDEMYVMERRAALTAALDAAIQSGQRIAADRDSGQMNFFGAFTQGGPDDGSEEGSGPKRDEPTTLPNVAPWSNKQALDFEKEVLGFYVSSHPLDDHREALQRFGTCTIGEAAALPAEVKVVVGGILTRVRPTLVKRGKSAGSKMAMLTLEDGQDKIDAVCFADAYATSHAQLELDRVVFLAGRIDRRREDSNLIVDHVAPVENAAQALTQTVKIIVHDRRPDAEGSAFNGEFGRLKEVLRQASRSGADERAPAGGAGVVLELHQAGKVVSLRLPGVRVAVSGDLPHHIAAVLNQAHRGEARCELLGAEKVKAGEPDALRNGAAATPRGAPRSSARDERPPAFASSRGKGEVCASIDRY